CGGVIGIRIMCPAPATRTAADPDARGGETQLAVQQEMVIAELKTLRERLSTPLRASLQGLHPPRLFERVALAEGDDVRPRAREGLRLPARDAEPFCSSRMLGLHVRIVAAPTRRSD